MTATRSGSRELAEEVGKRSRDAAGQIRRMIVTRTNSALYQVTGHRLLDGTTETRDAEVFAGVGFASRPAAGVVEAIVAFPGGPGNPIIIATRQESVRRVIAADLAADETQLHNSLTLIRIMADGTVEIRTAGGVAEPVAKASELQALAADFYAHIHADASSAPTTGPIAAFSLPDPPGAPLVDPGQPGTDVLKAE